MGSMPVKHSVLNVKVLSGAFNQEKDLVGGFSVIAKTDGSLAAPAQGSHRPGLQSEQEQRQQQPAHC